MGHDISGFNKIGEEVAYARFNMWNHNASFLYRILEADDYNAGVSGTGNSSTFSLQQIEQALNTYKKIYGHADSNKSNSDLLDWDLKQILHFIQNCLSTAQKEGSVRIYFG
jgi:hypothetical protein